MRLLLFFFLLCLSLAAPPAARAHASSASSKESQSSSPVDLSRPPREITPEIIAHLREAARAACGGEEKTAAEAVAGLGRAHSALLSRVAALSSSSAGSESEKTEGGR